MKKSAFSAKKGDRDKKKQKIVLYLIVIALVILFVAVLIKDTYKKNQINQAALQLKKGETAFSNGDYEGAIKSFKKSIKLNPTYRAYNGLASSYAALNKNVLAVEYYSKSLTLNPNDGTTHRLVGNLFYKLRQYELAITQFKKAVILNPQDFLAFNAMGLSLRKLGNHKDSLKFYNQSLNIRYNEPALEGIGIAYYFLGDYDNAIKYLSETQESGIYTTYGLFKLSFAHIRKGNYDKAIEMASEHLDKNPDDRTNYLMYNVLGAAYMFKNEFDKSIDNYHKSLIYRSNTSESIPTIQLEIGYVYLLSGDNKKAIDYLEKSVMAKLTNDGFKGLEAAYLFLGEQEKARVYAEKNLTVKRSYILASLLGTAYLKHNNYERAKKEFDESITLNPYYYLPYEGLGKLHYQLNDFATARTYLEKSLELNPLSDESKRLLQEIKK